MSPIIAIRLIPVFLLTTLVAGVANAGEDYRCTIKRVSWAGKEFGSTFELFKQAYVGKDFTVERGTGLMAGALKNSYATKPQVIDYGSKENSYKVVTTMKLEESSGSDSNIFALTISEYEPSPKKSFVFLNNDDVYFGDCDHF
jgi:hypothetical protein